MKWWRLMSSHSKSAGCLSWHSRLMGESDLMQPRHLLFITVLVSQQELRRLALYSLRSECLAQFPCTM